MHNSKICILGMRLGLCWVVILLGHWACFGLFLIGLWAGFVTQTDLAIFH